MNSIQRGYIGIAAITIIAFCALESTAQTRFPAPSSGAMIKQSIGITDVSITYSRPGVKGREIWGKIVPYNELWRTGANLSTLIEVSDDVMIEGQKLPAGKYSLFSIPAQQGEWTVILNKATGLGGTAGYKQEDDVFRVKVKPQMLNTVNEWLQFSFEDLTDTSASIVLSWEKLRLPIKMTVNTQELTFGKARTAALNAPFVGFANYALQTGANLDEALKMTDASLSMQETYRANVIKARLLERLGKKSDAMKALEKGIALGKAAKTAPFDLADNEKLLVTWKTGK
jgi:hypothetical protein